MTAISPVGLTREIVAAANAKLNPSQPQANPTQAGNFSDHLQKALSQVAAAQAESGRMAQAFERGDETDVAKVMLAREKSSLAFEATLQIRNKLLSAYKYISSMPV